MKADILYASSFSVSTILDSSCVVKVIF